MQREDRGGVNNTKNALKSHGETYHFLSLLKMHNICAHTYNKPYK